jgi:hypothetical protein
VAAGLVLWLDAQQLSLAEGAALTTWTDASGAGHHAVQSNAAQRPTWRGSAVNGRPAIRFDGIDDHLDIGATLVPGAAARTVLFVARTNVVGNKSVIDLGHGGTPGSAFMITPEYAVRVGGGNRVFRPGASSAPELGVILQGGGTTADLSAWVNGQPLTVASTGARAINTAGDGTVGGYSAAPTGFHCFDGDIAEILVYNRALSASERLSVAQYLAGKYGIALAPTPQQLPGLRLWLDAGAVTGVADGGALALWSDRSGAQRCPRCASMAPTTI